MIPGSPSGLRTPSGLCTSGPWYRMIPYISSLRSPGWSPQWIRPRVPTAARHHTREHHRRDPKRCHLGVSTLFRPIRSCCAPLGFVLCTLPKTPKSSVWTLDSPLPRSPKGVIPVCTLVGMCLNPLCLWCPDGLMIPYASSLRSPGDGPQMGPFLVPNLVPK